MKISNLILLMCCFLLLVDSIQGLLLHNGLNIPLSSAYKGVILLLVGLFLYFNNKKDLVKALIVTSIFLVMTIIHFISHNTLGYLIQDIFYLFKFLSFFYFYFFAKNLLRKYPQKLNLLKSVFKLNLFIIIINIFLGYLGFGFQQYYGEIGTRGFFYAGNEISSTFLVISSFFLFNVYKRQYFKSYLLFSTILVFCAIGSATKVSIIGIILIIIIVPNLSNEKISLLKTRNLKKIFSIIVVLPFMIIVVYQLLKSTEIFGRFQYYYDKLDLISFILSSRNIFLAELSNIIKDSFTYIDYLVGVGPKMMAVLTNKVIGYPKAAELDLFDMFFYYGLVGSIFTVSYWIYFIKKPLTQVKYCNNIKISQLVFVINLLIIIIAIFAGHIIFSGTLTVFWGLLNGLIYTNHEATNGN